MENNQPEFNMEKYNDFLKKIKIGSPVHKINFSLESPNAIVGMYLITLPDTKSYVDKSADYNDLVDNTLLVFESRHVIECCQIIHGCLNIIGGVGLTKVGDDFIIDKIIKALLSKPIRYKDALSELEIISNMALIKNDENEEIKKICESFKYIIKNIWFVPYGRIDEIAEEAINEFKKMTGDDSNE